MAPKTPETPSAVSQPKETITELSKEQKLLANTLASLSSVGGSAFSKSNGLGKRLTQLVDWKNSFADPNILANEVWISPELIRGTITKLVYPSSDGKWILYLSTYRSSQNVWLWLIGDSHKKSMQVSSTESFMITLDPKNPKNVQVTKLSSPLYTVSWGKDIVSFSSQDWDTLKKSVQVWQTLSVSGDDLKALIGKVQETIDDQWARNTAKEKAALATLKWEVKKIMKIH